MPMEDEKTDHKYSLWVYFDPSGDSEPAIQAILAAGPGKWEGQGCCTDGLADISWQYASARDSHAAYEALRALPVSRLKLLQHCDDGELVELRLWEGTD